MVELIITLLAMFVVLPGVILLIFVYLPARIRSYRLSAVAKEFGLIFNNNNKFSLSLSYLNSYQRNYMKGTIHNHEVEIYDSYGLKTMEFVDAARKNYYKRRTVFVIDGVKTEYCGVLFGLPSVFKIKAILNIV